MALTPEDGSVVAGADSYCSLAYATTYHGDRGNASWAALASDTVREQCLRKATDYMVQVYRGRWQGQRKQDGQSLDWPRVWVVVDHYAVLSTIVPTEVKNACAELALKAATSTLYADQSQGVIREKIGPLETEYDKSSPVAVRYKAVDSMLRPYLDFVSGIGIRV